MAQAFDQTMPYPAADPRGGTRGAWHRRRPASSPSRRPPAHGAAMQQARQHMNGANRDGHGQAGVRARNAYHAPDATVRPPSLRRHSLSGTIQAVRRYSSQQALDPSPSGPRVAGDVGGGACERACTPRQSVGGRACPRGRCRCGPATRSSAARRSSSATPPSKRRCRCTWWHRSPKSWPRRQSPLPPVSPPTVAPRQHQHALTLTELPLHAAHYTSRRGRTAPSSPAFSASV
jgi:hypothetical protein